MIVIVGVEKMSVSFDPALGEAIRTSAAERPLEPGSSRAVGELCATGTADIVDAHVALLATDHDTVVTSDPGDITLLLRAAGCSARSVRC